MTVVRCVAFEALDGIAHGFSTREPPGDVGRQAEAAAAFARRRAVFLRACGLPPDGLVFFRQVHGTRVLDVSGGWTGDGSTEADAAVAVDDGAVPGVRWADCVPLLLASVSGRAVAAVHAGWRGTAAGVVPAAVARLAAHGVEPAELLAALGPAIGGCCYEVGDDVVTQVAAAVGVPAGQLARRVRGRWRLDLRRAVRRQLLAAGVPGHGIGAAPWCTACAAGLFYSHRREGAAAGRQMACIGRAASLEA